MIKKKMNEQIIIELENKVKKINDRCEGIRKGYKVMEEISNLLKSKQVTEKTSERNGAYLIVENEIKNYEFATKEETTEISNLLKEGRFNSIEDKEGVKITTRNEIEIKEVVSRLMTNEKKVNKLMKIFGTKENREKIIYAIIINVLTEETNNKYKNDKQISQANFIYKLGEQIFLAIIDQDIIVELDKIFSKKKLIIECLERINKIKETSDIEEKIKFIERYVKKKREKEITVECKEEIEEVVTLIIKRILKRIRVEYNTRFINDIEVNNGIKKIIESNIRTKEELGIYIKVKLDNKMTRTYMEYGKELAQPLYKNIIRLVENEIGLGVKPRYIELKDKSVRINKRIKYPRIGEESKEMYCSKRYDKGVTKELYEYTEKKIKENNYLETSVKKSLKDKNVVKFKINEMTVMKLLTDLDKIMINSNEVKDIEVLTEESKKFIKTQKYSSKILKEIYEIDFELLLENAVTNNIEEKKILEIVVYARDFNKYELSGIYSSILDKKNKEDKTNITRYINKIISKKIEINEMLNTITVMRHFKYFMYDTFYDARLRCYVDSTSMSYTSNYLIRSMLSFYEQKKNTQYNIQKILLEKQIMAICKNMQDLEESLILGNIKLGEYYNCYSLVNDYKGYMLDPINYRFTSVYSLDASNSGLQMLAIINRNANLASHCRLLNSDLDSYTLAIEHINKTISSTREYLVNILEPGLLMKIIEKIKLKEIAKYKFIKAGKVKDINTEEIVSKNSKFIFDYSKYFDLEFELLDSQKLKLELIMQIIKMPNQYKNKRNPKQFKSKTEFKYLQFLIYIIDNILVVLKENTWLNSYLLDRNLAKPVIMNIPHGLTRSGVINEIVNYFNYESMIKGKIVSDTKYKIIKKFSGFLATILENWFDKQLPEAKIFAEVCTNLINKNLFNSIYIENKYIIVHYLALKKNSIRISAGELYKSRHKRITINYYIPVIDLNKIKNTYIANLVHFCDAYLLRVLVEKFQKLDINYFTVHDRFYISPYHADKLLNLAKEAYLELFNADLLKSNLEINRFRKDLDNIQLEFIKTELDRLESLRDLETLNFMNSNFIKH